MDRDDDWPDICEDWQVLYGKQQNKRRRKTIHQKEDRDSEKKTVSHGAGSVSSPSENHTYITADPFPISYRQKVHQPGSIRMIIRNMIILFLILSDLLFIYVIIRAFLLVI